MKKRVSLNLTELTSYFIILMEIILILFYLHYLGKDAIYTIPVKNILAVEKLEESSFNKKNVSYMNNHLRLFKLHILLD